MSQHNVAMLDMQRLLTLFVMLGSLNKDIQHDVEREWLKASNLKNQGSILAILGSY